MRAIIGFMAIGAAMVGTPAQAKCEVGQLLEFPVTMVGLQPMVTASVDGHDARFVADSGAFSAPSPPAPRRSSA